MDTITRFLAQAPPRKIPTTKLLTSTSEKYLDNYYALEFIKRYFSLLQKIGR